MPNGTFKGVVKKGFTLLASGQQLSNHKGGRPLSSYAMEYCLTLPKGYRPTPKQWQSVIKDCCIALAKHCKLNKTEFAQFRQQIRAVVHQQYKSSKGGSGDHVHLVIGKVVGIRNLKELQQKKATKLIKQPIAHQLASNQTLAIFTGADTIIIDFNNDSVDIQQAEEKIAVG